MSDIDTEDLNAAASIIFEMMFKLEIKQDLIVPKVHYGCDNKTSGSKRSITRSVNFSDKNIDKLKKMCRDLGFYPPTKVREQLAKDTGLSLVQINNWMSNAKKRKISLI